MKLYEVTNGYTGYSYVRCLVIAENEEQAKDLATAKYKEVDGYGDDYWANLEAECMCEDTSKTYVGNIED